MNKITIDEFRKGLTTIDAARKLNIDDFPYVEARKKSVQYLKALLQEQFGSTIRFDRDETFSYVKAEYKGIKIEIKVDNGVTLTIENSVAECIINDFTPVFTEIFEAPAICKYHFYSGVNHSLNPAAEWNINPEERIFELVHGYNGHVKGYFTKFRDLYTPYLIKKLGDNLLTPEGYDELFGSELNDKIGFRIHKVIEILKMHPNLDLDAINNWLAKTKKDWQLTKENLKQHDYCY